MADPGGRGGVIVLGIATPTLQFHTHTKLTTVGMEGIGKLQNGLGKTAFLPPFGGVPKRLLTHQNQAAVSAPARD